MAAFGAGSICTLLTNPLSVVRSRILLSDKNHGKRNYSTIGRTIVHIAKTEGIAGFYKVIIHIQSTPHAWKRKKLMKMPLTYKKYSL